MFWLDSLDTSEVKTQENRNKNKNVENLAHASTHVFFHFIEKRHCEWKPHRGVYIWKANEQNEMINFSDISCRFFLTFEYHVKM